MADKKQPGSSRPSAAPGAACGSIDSAHEKNSFSIDLERLSSSDISLELATTHDIESQTELAAAAGKEMQSSRDDSTTADGSNGSHERITTVGSPVSKWRWIGQKDLRYLVANRRTPPAQPEGVASALELKHGNDPDSSSAGAPVVAAVDSLEKGAFVRVVTEGAGIPTSLEAGSEGGRQRIAHILLPTEGNSPDNPSHLPPVCLLTRQELSAARATAAAPPPPAGGKKRKVWSAVPDRNGPRLRSQDLEKGKVYDEAIIRRGGDAARDAANGYYHQQDDDNEPLCRICQQGSGKAEVINLGCACKLDLGLAHRGCAETWFQVKGNRQCEVCGKIAQNVQLLEPKNDTQTTYDPPETAENPPETVITVVNVHHPLSSCSLNNRSVYLFVLIVCVVIVIFVASWRRGEPTAHKRT